MTELDLGGSSLVSLDYSTGDALPPTVLFNGSFTVAGLPVDHDPLIGHHLLFGERLEGRFGDGPTLERLCLHFAGRLKSEFPTLARVTVSRPTVGERCALSVDA